MEISGVMRWLSCHTTIYDGTFFKCRNSHAHGKLHKKLVDYLNRSLGRSKPEQVAGMAALAFYVPALSNLSCPRMSKMPVEIQ